MGNKYTLNIFPLAQNDFESIFCYIANTLMNRTAANDLINDFHDALDRVCEFPESCPLLQNEFVKDPYLRKLIVNNYIIFYKISNHEIQVIRVLSDLMDYFEVL